MKKFLLAFPLIGSLAACQPGGLTTNQATAAGALGGAAVGATVADDDVEGAVIGAALGGIAGNVIGRTQNGQCVYENSAGQRYTAACP
jgi:outer membrane lipoprotein SlyB